MPNVQFNCDGGAPLKRKNFVTQMVEFRSGEVQMSDLFSSSMPVLKIPPNPVAIAATQNLASEFYKRMVEMINAFNEKLDQAHEVGMRLVSFGQSIVFH